ncbi:hypothetical protein F5050DRAFT_1813249 [Lentinula boryana]|uniref:Uncharacterized protein n=1 Tax=Lentinula boryana TaxID=40481 RepID=A0ABQ8PXI3_9AGAR|nr:hypothetical protein F5050DRAFT_1813249 [Lentinula boryana]
MWPLWPELEQRPFTFAMSKSMGCLMPPKVIPVALHLVAIGGGPTICVPSHFFSSCQPAVTPAQLVVIFELFSLSLNYIPEDFLVDHGLGQLRDMLVPLVVSCSLQQEFEFFEEFVCRHLSLVDMGDLVMGFILQRDISKAFLQLCVELGSEKLRRRNKKRKKRAKVAKKQLEEEKRRAEELAEARRGKTREVVASPKRACEDILDPEDPPYKHEEEEESEDDDGHESGAKAPKHKKRRVGKAQPAPLLLRPLVCGAWSGGWNVAVRRSPPPFPASNAGNPKFSVLGTLIWISFQAAAGASAPVELFERMVGAIEGLRTSVDEVAFEIRSLRTQVGSWGEELRNCRLREAEVRELWEFEREMEELEEEVEENEIEMLRQEEED